MQDDRLTLTMTTDNLYPIIEWVDEAGVRVGAIVTHEFSNPKDTDGDGVPDTTYRHAHMSIYVSDASGVAVGRVDVPYGHDHTQVQIEHADLVLKGKACAVILREGDEFFRLRVGADPGGNHYLWPEKVASSYIIPASVPA